MRARQYQSPMLDPGFLAKYAEEDDPFTSNAGGVIGRFYQWIDHIPNEFVWHYQTADDFRARVHEITSASPRDFNRLWWSDMLGQCQAFSMLSAWRTLDLVKSTIWAIRRNELLTAATVARAALETAANYAWFQRTVRPTFDDIWTNYRGDVTSGTSIVISAEIEDEILRTLYASREPGTEEIYFPRNIITKIQKISKLPGQDVLLPNYERLCEYVHPNMLGTFVFAKRIDGAMRIQNRYSDSADGIVRPVLFALSWSCNTLPLSVNALQESAGRLMRLVEVGKR